MRTTNFRAEMGTLFLLVVLLISSTASLEKKCPSNILKKFLSDPSKAKEYYRNGDTILVTCLADSGHNWYDYFYYDGSDGWDTKNNDFVLKCTDGKWIGHYPECFSNCSKPDIYAILNPEYDVYAPGDNVTVTACKQDNAEIEGDTTLICMADGTWIGSARCPKPISCPPPKQILHGHLIQETNNGLLNIYQSTIRYDCDKGYRIVGPRFRKCQSDRTWSGNDTKCEEIVCEKPSPPENGNVYLTDNSAKVGSQIEYICNEHHILEPSTSQFAICTVHGHWSIPQPRCIKICKVRALSHGSIRTISGFLRKITKDSYVHDNTELDFTCNYGYEKYASGYENLEKLKCINGALHPGSPECRPRYRIVGPRVRKCQSDRTWSGNDTKCEEIVCEKPSSPENGKVYLTDNSQKVGSKIEYICDEHHIMEPITSQFAICTVHGQWSSPQPRCIKICEIRALSHGSIRTISGFQRKITEDFNVHGNTELYFTCNDGYERYASGYETQGRLKCVNGALLPGSPECRPKRCFIEPPIDLEYFIGQEQVLEKYIHSGILMHARCSNRTELFRLSSYLDSEQVFVKCNLGKLEPESLFCQDKRCNIVTRIENGHFRNRDKVIVTGEKIISGSNIKLICSEGYELYNKTNSMYLELEQTDIKCYQGSFTPEIPSCKPRRCFIEPPVHLEYFIEGNKVLHKYVDHGIIMQARCPDQMELVLSSSYLDNEQTFVQCIWGILEPRTLDCKGKSCKPPVLTEAITEFVAKGNKSTPENYFPHDQSVEAVCKDGYRQQGTFTCQEGIWTGNSTCEPEVCNGPEFQFIVVKNGTLVNEDIIFSHGTKLNASCDSSYTLHADEGSGGNGTSTECIHGEWKPKFSCKQMCKTIDVSREITSFIVSETKTTPGEFVPHNQSIETVCGEGYRPHGILTCNAGIWMGNSTCEPDVTGCVLNDPGMHFISLEKRTVLKVGENANVSCKFGYQIVPNIFAKRAYEYDYDDSETTADPSEMPETEDNENLIAVSDGTYTCGDNGKWEPELRFSCEQIMCDSFYGYNLENGNIFYSTHQVDTVGTVVAFQCNPGYTRHGPETRTCQIDGTWSGQCVTCQTNTRNSSMTCHAPCVPEGARKTGSHTYEIGSRVEFYCTRSKTQDIDDRRNIRHCIKNGKYASWNGTMINCKEIICDKGDHYGFENGKVKYSSSVAYVGTEASFMCNPGYNRHGHMTRICQKDGTWSGECVTCQKHQSNSSTCPAPCVPDGAIKIGSLSYEIGSRIQLYCFQSNMNYNVENSYIRHCVNDGKSASWNGSNINCKAKCEPLTDTYNIIQTGVVPGIISDKTVVELNCSGSLAPVQAECSKGHWRPKKPTCKYTCSLSAIKGTLYSYKIKRAQVFPGPIESGRQIKVTCEDGFFPNTQNYDVSKCVNGVWTPEIVKCEKTDNF